MRLDHSSKFYAIRGGRASGRLISAFSDSGVFALFCNCRLDDFAPLYNTINPCSQVVHPDYDLDDAEVVKPPTHHPITASLAPSCGCEPSGWPRACPPFHIRFHDRACGRLVVKRRWTLSFWCR